MVEKITNGINHPDLGNVLVYLFKKLIEFNRQIKNAFGFVDAEPL
jgi:hypothetical protein